MKKICFLLLVVICVITLQACSGLPDQSIENNHNVTQVATEASITTSLPAAHETPAEASATLRPLPRGMPTVEIDLNKMLAVLRRGEFSFLKDLAVEHYAEEDFARPGRLTYTVSFRTSETIFFNYGWCAANLDTLNQNLDHIELAFFFNDQKIPDEYILRVDNTLDDGWECANGGMLLTDWNPGQYHFQVIASFDEKMNDGRQDFDAGDYVMDYDVSAH